MISERDMISFSQRVEIKESVFFFVIALSAIEHYIVFVRDLLKKLTRYSSLSAPKENNRQQCYLNLRRFKKVYSADVNKKVFYY